MRKPAKDDDDEDDEDEEDVSDIEKDFFTGGGWEEEIISKKQAQNHQRWKKIFEEQCNQDVLVFLSFIQHDAKNKNWKFSTLRTYLGAFLGMMARFFPSILIPRKFMEFVNVIEKKKIQEEVDYPEPITFPHVSQALSFLLSHSFNEPAVCLSMMWSTSARPGCVLQLKRANVHLIPPNNVAFRFVNGKGVLMRKGPFVIHSLLPEPFFSMLSKMIKDGVGDRIFPQEKERFIRDKMRAAMRLINVKYELRSVRRGVLENMAAAGAPDEMLLLFSGHLRKQTLYRYLRDGLARRADPERTLVASTLWACGGPNA